MATTDYDSRGDSRLAGQQDGSIWLDGDVLACACPDCGAPMSIRLWLLLADCFRCGASVELTEEQQQAARRLLEAKQETRWAETRAAAAAIQPTAARRKTPKPAAPAAPKRVDPKPPPRTPPSPAHPAGRVPAALAHRGARVRIRRTRERGLAGGLFGDLLHNLPAWLVSLVFHTVAILLLGLWMIEPPEQSLGIFLSTGLSYQDLPGETGDPENLANEAFEFDDAGATDYQSVMADMLGANDEMAEMAKMDVDVPDSIGRMPSLEAEDMAKLPPAPAGGMLSGRDPALRASRLRREGGTSYTEAAVGRGIEWIARHQNPNGSWSLDAFSRTAECHGRCDGGGRVHSDTAGTAMALLPMLGAGQTHVEGQYTTAVFNGLRWLTYQQGRDGDLRGEGGGRMYAHGLAAIVLCEAYGLTGDSRLREPAQKSLDFIVKAQHAQGGWRYEPGEAADTSVVGWQLMALRSGQMARLSVPTPVFALADRYLDRAATDRYGSRYGYLPGREPTPTMTAEALLCRQYVGWPKDHPGLLGGVDYLLENLPGEGEPNVYYWYYASQVMHQLGGEPWERWNARMRVVLTGTQEKKGHEAGSWTPRGAFAPEGGRLYMTSLAVCTLEVYYRHLPLYRQEVLDEF
ncbi:MAG: terpene cyclase/mutase family protein [Planctomycetia bacterium]|nr:terpene cyclase/mutase family protein [Planctomycetia bacterium]